MREQGRRRYETKAKAKGGAAVLTSDWHVLVPPRPRIYEEPMQQRFSESDIAVIRKMVAEGRNAVAIAQALRRTPQAIYDKCSALGIRTAHFYKVETPPVIPDAVLKERDARLEARCEQSLTQTLMGDPVRPARPHSLGGAAADDMVFAYDAAALRFVLLGGHCAPIELTASMQ
jgi:hypothetical protein